jgi:hypothetical protein
VISRHIILLAFAWSIANAAAGGRVDVIEASILAQVGSPSSEESGITKVALDRLLARRDPAALLELARRFDNVVPKLEKQRIAVVLVSRAADDTRFLDFLLEEARRAIDSDMPFPLAFDGSGALLPKQYSPAFLRWTYGHGTTAELAATTALSGAPLDVMMLGLTRDSRARDLLLRGLESPNVLVAFRASWGLARIGDTAAASRVIAAAESAPRDAARLIGEALVLFDTPEAQTAAARFVDDPILLDSLRQNAKQQLEMNIGWALPAWNESATPQR